MPLKTRGKKRMARDAVLGGLDYVYGVHCNRFMHCFFVFSNVIILPLISLFPLPSPEDPPSEIHNQL